MDDSSDDDKSNLQSFSEQSTSKSGYEGRRRGARSVAWNYFTIVSKTHHIASCNVCKARFSYRTSVTNLTKHYRNKHGDIDIDLKLSDSQLHNFEVETENNEATKKNVKIYSKPSQVWSFLKNRNHKLNTAECAICNKTLTTTSVSNMRKHFQRKHPQLNIDEIDNEDRILLSTENGLFELATSPKHEKSFEEEVEENEMCEEVYLENSDFSDVEPITKERKSIPNYIPTKKRKISNNYDMEKTKKDSLYYFIQYLRSLMEKLPDPVSIQLQSSFIRQVMEAHVSYQANSVQGVQNNFTVTISNDEKVIEPEQEVSHEVTVINECGNRDIIKL